MLKKLTVAFYALMFGSGYVFSDTIYWKNNVSGSWSDPAMWSLGQLPQDGDVVKVDRNTEYTVTLPDGNYSLKPQSLRFSISNGGNLTVDGRGGSFTMPASDTDNYLNEPWGINASKGHMFNLETYNITDAKKHAVVAMTNALFTVSCENDDVRLDIKEGFINFYDPAGVPYTHPFTVAGYPQANLEIHVYSNAHLRLPQVNFRANAHGTNLFAFHGGTNEILKAFAIPSNNFTPSVTSKGELLVTDGGKLSMESVSMGGYVTLSGITYHSTNRTSAITVDKGSEIIVSGNVVQKQPNIFELDVKENSSFTVNGSVELGYAQNSTSVVNVADSYFTNTSVIVLGNTKTSGYAFFNATNSTVTLKELSLGNGLFYAEDSDTLIDFFYPGYKGGSETYGNAVFNGGKVKLGTVFCGLNRPGGAVFKGGVKASASGNFYVAKDPGCRADLTIDGDDTVLSTKSVNVGEGGFGTVYMKGGTWTLPSGVIQLGNQSSSTGIVEQTGGNIIVDSNLGLCIGVGGNGIYEISGGTANMYQIRLGYYTAVAGPTNILRMTGGLIEVTNTDNERGVNVCDATNTICMLELNGGVLRSHRVRGWTGASAKGGNGWAVLKADGGTIRSHAASEGFVENFDEAKLGEKGLTLESGYAVTISQNFTNKDGENGRLILSGSGVKTLTGSDSRESILELAGGTTLFAAGASHKSAVIVTNSAVLSFTGDSTGGTFKGLSIGSDSSTGFLAIELSDKIVLESAPVIGNFGLHIADETYENGTYTLITCPGEVSEEIAKAWSIGYVFSGRLEGFAYSFATAYDSERDVTSFNLVVSQGSGITGSSVWKGPGSDWMDEANWDSALPGSSSAAVFSQDSAPSPVNLADNVMVAALDFNASKKYTVEGSGTVFLSDSGETRISASGGAVDLNMGLNLPASVNFAVTEPAVLTLNGAVKRGGIVKSGTGRLFLGSDNNELISGIRVSEGLLSLSSFASAGMNNAAYRQLNIDGGTLEFRSGAAGTVPFSIVVQADAGEAVGIKNDSDITVPSIAVNSGNIIKRGKGTIVFTGDSTLSSDNGQCKVNETPSADVQSFPSNGVMPTAGYSGFNVAEGEVVFKDDVFSIPNAISVGLATLDVSDAEPSFVVDGATVNTGMSSYHFLLGANAYVNQAKFTRPRLVIKNGGYLSVNTLNVGKYGAYDIYPEIELDGGTLYGSWCLNISERKGSYATYTISNGSRLLSSNEMNWRGTASLVFRNSLFAKNTSLALAKILVEKSANGSWVFADGSEFYCEKITQTAKNTVTFAFDGGRWIPSKSGNYGFVFRGTDCITVDTRSEKGLYLAPGANCEWRIAKAVTGVGGVVLDGEGTLRFVTQEVLLSDGATNKIGAAGTDTAITSPYTLDFDGPLDIASGSVVVEEGAARTNAVFTGSGTLTAVNCVSPVFKLSVSDEYIAQRVLTLDGFTSVKSVTVDLGRTAENPLKRPFSEIVVARYVGDAPDVSAWKATGTGLKMVVGSCRAEDGNVIMTLRTAGSVMIFK